MSNGTSTSSGRLTADQSERQGIARAQSPATSRSARAITA